MTENVMYLSRTYVLSEPFGSPKDVIEIRRIVAHLRANSVHSDPVFHSVVLEEETAKFKFVYENPLDRMLPDSELEVVFDSLGVGEEEEHFERSNEVEYEYCVSAKAVAIDDSVLNEDESTDTDSEEAYQATTEKLLH